ncbi:carbohydrate sulfotransferase 5-like [Convolutriloba macropyga]|uniref:carbohydrate sulfotransferase 5-like n=1 Tax=Convolutriloba macropyga TaxID=536237 RepID=UPI003F5222D3
MHRFKFIFIVLSIFAPALWSFYSSRNAKFVNRISVEQPRYLVPKLGKPLIIILTYMRSGSTLLGEVFKQHKDVLYLFEPFRVAEKSGESDSESKEKKLNWLHRFLKCNFNDVFKWSKDPLIAKKKGGLSLEKSSFPLIDDDHKKQLVNLTQLTRKCQHPHTLFVMKTIRMHLGDLRQFLTTNTGVKLIHLIRDPRAVELSRRNMPHSAQRGILGTDRVCDRVWQDVQESDKFVQEFGSDRILRLTYDEIILDQINVIKKLHLFANIQLYDSTLDKFFHLTHADRKIGGGFRPTSARNASYNLNRWKNELPKEVIDNMESTESCKQLIETIGERTKHLRDY